MVYIKSCKGLYKNEKTKMPASDLVLEPVKEVIKGMDALDIDGIICATITKDYIYPSASCMLGGKIKAKNAFCYDIESDFTGFITALRLAYSFIESKRYKNVLAVSSESFYICDDKDRFNDASVAALITSEKSNIQIDFIDSTTDGSALENCYIPMGGAVKPYTREGIINKEHFIYIKDNKIFEEEAKKSALYVKETLSKNNIEIDYYIPSYFNKESFDNFANNLSVDKDKIYSKMENSNSSLSATSGVAFSMALEDGSIKNNSKVALCGFGSGYTKALAVFSVS